MKKITKRITAAATAAVMAVTVTAVSLTNASATKNPDDTYTPSRGVEAKTYRFAMPGCWQSDYWRQNENCAGIYWWTGADTPGSVFTHDWPGYKMTRVAEAGVENLYSSPVPADANQIIINNHIDGGMPGTEGFLQERFDAACQINDTQSVYYAFMESPYYTKDLWKYAWDKAADEVGRTIDWSDDETRMTSEEATQISDIYDELLEAVDDDDFVLDIPEFGNYAKNFYVELIYQPHLFPKVKSPTAATGSSTTETASTAHGRQRSCLLNIPALPLTVTAARFSLRAAIWSLMIMVRSTVL